jgi:hypothetical protein
MFTHKEITYSIPPSHATEMLEHLQLKSVYASK